jgi:hypothetical protein
VKLEDVEAFVDADPVVKILEGCADYGSEEAD